MLQRLILTVILAFLFGFSQQGAIVHEISHYADQAPLSQKKDSSSHGSVCEKCLSYGQLASALGVAYFSPALLANTFEATQHYAAAHHASPEHAYSARAPPVFA
ncbi:MAG TPA: hypothetical protein VFS17_07155 [Methylophilaceae bacterium]|nr:hypothetical protein [Methylophilaceae bacterium]